MTSLKTGILKKKKNEQTGLRVEFLLWPNKICSISEALGCRFNLQPSTVDQGSSVMWLQCRSQWWFISDPWPGNSIYCGTPPLPPQPEKKKKKGWGRKPLIHTKKRWLPEGVDLRGAGRERAVQKLKGREVLHRYLQALTFTAVR